LLHRKQQAVNWRVVIKELSPIKKNKNLFDDL